MAIRATVDMVYLRGKEVPVGHAEWEVARARLEALAAVGSVYRRWGALASGLAVLSGKNVEVKFRAEDLSAGVELRNAEFGARSAPELVALLRAAVAAWAPGRPQEWADAVRQSAAGVDVLTTSARVGEGAPRPEEGKEFLRIIVTAYGPDNAVVHHWA